MTTTTNTKNFAELVNPVNGSVCATVADLRAWLNQFNDDETVEVWRRGYEAELVVTVGANEWTVDDFVD